MLPFLREDMDGCQVDFGMEVGEEAHIETLKRICAVECISVVCFPDETTSRHRYAHVYVQDDLEHHAADIFVGTIGRDDRHVTLEEITRALAKWSERDAHAFGVHWWNGDPQVVPA